LPIIAPLLFDRPLSLSPFPSFLPSYLLTAHPNVVGSLDYYVTGSI